MAKLTVTVGDTTVWQGQANSIRVDGDSVSLRMNADAVIEIDPESTKADGGTNGDSA